MTESSLPEPLVDPGWLADQIGRPDLIVVDASWYLAAQGRDARAEYRAGHIPGAIYWDLDLLSDSTTPLPHMLPSESDLAAAIGRLGIGSDDTVVVYDGSGTNLSAARVWWTLRIAGLSTVAVLDGGLGGWRFEGRPLETGWVELPEKRFSARYRAGMVRSLEQVVAATRTGEEQILDARSSGRFAGTEPEPRPGLRAGHVPGSRSLPYPELVDSDGRMRPVEELRRRFVAAGVDLTRPVITTCGSGVTACALALGLERIGHRSWAVYDGSWSEWGREGGPPVERGPARGSETLS